MTTELIRIGPSNISRIADCPGSAYKKHAIDNRKKSFAVMAEGTNAHKVIERSTPHIAARGFNIPASAEELCKDFPVVGHYFDDLLGSDYDLNDIHKYFLDVEYLVKTLMQLEDPNWFCELGLTAHKDSKLLIDGTADLVVLEVKNTPKGREARAVLIDFKFGQGEPVEMDDPKQSQQLYAYAVGVLNFVKDTFDAELTDICVAVSQPRSVFGAEMSHVVLNREQILTHQKELGILANKISDNPTSYVPGKHCKRCPVAVHCPKLREEEVIRNAAVAVISETASPEDIAYIIKMHDMVVNAKEEAVLAAYTLLMAGQEVPGLRIASGTNRKAYFDKAEAVRKALELGLTKDQILKDPVPVSAAAMYKLLTNLNMDPKGIIETVTGQHRVVDENARDKRTIPLSDITNPINPTEAATKMAQSINQPGK